MTHNLRTGLLGAAFAASLIASPTLFGQSVNTDYDHQAQLESYHTFSFAKIQTDNPLYQQRLRDDISHDLQAHGLQMVPSGGDLAITAIGGVHDKQEYNSFYSGLGPGFGWRGWGWLGRRLGWRWRHEYHCRKRSRRHTDGRSL